MAKAFNGAVAFALVDRGLISLDDTIGEWLPGMLPFGDAVTVGQALHHTGGLPEYIKTKAFSDRVNADPRAYISPPEILGFVRDEPLDFLPGTEYRYSDTDNIAVGLIVERATGLSYERALRALRLPPARTRPDLAARHGADAEAVPPRLRADPRRGARGRQSS